MKLPLMKQKPTPEQRAAIDKRRTAIDWMPVADIENSVTFLKTGEILATVELDRVNIELLSKNERKRKVNLLMEQLNGEEHSLQLFAIGRPVDLDMYIMKLEALLRDATHAKQKKILQMAIRNAADYAKDGTISERRFYMILRQKGADKKSVAELMLRAKALVVKLQRAEISARVCNDDEVFDLYCLFAFPSPGYEKQAKQWGAPPIYDNSMVVGESDAWAHKPTAKPVVKTKKQAVRINYNILNEITPDIEFSKNGLIFGNRYARTIAITKYPSMVSEAWLSRICNTEGIVCSIHMTPASTTELIDSLNKGIGEARATIVNGGNAITITRAEQKVRDMENLMRQIDQEQMSVMLVCVVLMVTAADKDELDTRVRYVESIFSGAGMRAGIIMFRQEDKLCAVAPYGELRPSVVNAAGRHMPMSTIAAMYPFTSAGINDGSGFILGKNSKGNIILLDIWKRGFDRTNSNMTILGVPGVGKSTAVKHILLNEFKNGTKILILDPENEYKYLCHSLDGDSVNCGGGAGGRINPFQIKPVPDDTDGDMPEDESGKRPLALHIQTLHTFFRLYMNDLSNIQWAVLERCIEEVYAKFGITYETQPEELALRANEQYPVFNDLYEYLLQKQQYAAGEKNVEIYEHLATLLRSIAVGADSALWNGHTTVASRTRFTVLDTFDLQEADNAIKRTQFFNILTWCWQQVSQNREERVLLVIDEAYLIIDPEVPQALQFVRNISKRIRKYEGGLIIISQSAADFLDPAVKQFGQAVVDNAGIKLVMGSDGKNLEELSQLWMMTEAEMELCLARKRGNGLLIVGSTREHAVIELAEGEAELFGKGGGK